MTDNSNVPAVRPDVPVDVSGFAPRNIDEAYRLGDGFAKSGFFPALKTGSQVLVAMQIAKDTRVPFTSIAQNVMFVNGRVSLFGDALLGVAYASGGMTDFEETCEGEGDEAVATCRVVKKGIVTPIIRRFSVADAKAAKLWGKAGPWQTYPKRMLQMRARAWALRDAGVTSGLSSAEELRDVKLATVENPPALPEPAKQRWDAIVTGGPIKEAVFIEKKAAAVEVKPAEATPEPSAESPNETDGRDDFDSPEPGLPF